MPFDLSIEFVGMCLYVPTANPARLHVLLVAPDQASPVGGHRHEAHHPRVFYDAKHVDPTATGFYSMALNDKLLDLTRFVGTTPLNTTLLDVPNLTTITGIHVPPALVGPIPTALIGGRVMVGSGSGTEHTNGPWNMQGFPPLPRQITFAVTWAMPDINAATLDWELVGLNGHGDQRLLPLTPLPDPANPGRQQVKLRIVNVPHHEVSAIQVTGTAPAPGTPAGHYSGHYSVFAGATTTPIPIYTGPGVGGGTGTSYSCMPAQGIL